LGADIVGRSDVLLTSWAGDAFADALPADAAIWLRSSSG
jgi:hypothetical protein